MEENATGESRWIKAACSRLRMSSWGVSRATASFTHVRTPAVRRHIEDGAQTGRDDGKEIMEVLKLCVIAGRPGL